MKKFLILFFVLFCLLPIAPSQAFSESKVVINPYIIDEKGAIGEIFDYKIKIKNNSDQQVSLYALVNNILPEGGWQPWQDPSQMDKSTSLANWISIKRGVIEIKPSEEVEVPLSIKVGIFAKPGKYYAAVTFAEGGNTGVAEENMGAAFQTRLMINMEVQEHIVEKAQISKFKPLRNFNIKYPVGIDLGIENLGNKEITPTGKIFIYNKKGEEVADIEVSNGNIGAGVNKEQIYNWNGGKGFGKFKAKLNIEYGADEKRDLQDVIYFWVLPLPVLIIFIVGLFIIALSLTLILLKKSSGGKRKK